MHGTFGRFRVWGLEFWDLGFRGLGFRDLGLIGVCLASLGCLGFRVIELELV